MLTLSHKLTWRNPDKRLRAMICICVFLFLLSSAHFWGLLSQYSHSRTHLLIYELKTNAQQHSSTVQWFHLFCISINLENIRIMNVFITTTANVVRGGVGVKYSIFNIQCCKPLDMSQYTLQISQGTLIPSMFFVESNCNDCVLSARSKYREHQYLMKPIKIDIFTFGDTYAGNVHWIYLYESEDTYTIHVCVSGWVCMCSIVCIMCSGSSSGLGYIIRFRFSIYISGASSTAFIATSIHSWVYSAMCMYLCVINLQNTKFLWGIHVSNALNSYFE